MTPDTPCRCPLTDEFLAAGQAVRLCHHSSLQEIADAKRKLRGLIEKFDVNLKLSDLFSMSPAEGVDYYIEQTSGLGKNPDMDFMERAIYTTAFMRDYAILIQFALAETLEEIRLSVTNGT